MTIEFIYFDGCPNIEATRENIRSACKTVGVRPEWKEYNQSDENVPDYIQGYGSPTILVNGRDVAGEKSDCCSTGNCRIYDNMTGVPSIQLIQQALEKQS